MAKAQKVQPNSIKTVNIARIKIQWAVIPIIGQTPFSPHKLSAEARRQLDRSKKDKVKIKKQTINPQEEFARSLYWLNKKGCLIEDGKDPLKHKYGFGMKASAFKQGMIAAGRKIEGVTMTELRPIFHVFGAKDTTRNFVKIDGVPEIECEFGEEAGVWVRIGGQGPGTGTPDIRYRATFKQWSATLYIHFNPDWISEEQLFNLVNIAGFVAGIGEDRPGKKGGTGGMYCITNRIK